MGKNKENLDLKEYTIKKFQYLEPLIIKSIMSIRTKMKFNNIE